MSYNMTEVLLLRVPLESDYKQTLWFASKSAQEQYFKSKKVHTGVDFSYQRKDKMIRWNDDYDSLIGCNYVMYRNAHHGNKWFYAFITSMEYVSDGRTNIYIETDVIQTWLFDYTVQPSFVEREHVDDDTVGIHTIPEQLETGEYVINSKNNNNALQRRCLIMGTTLNLNSQLMENTMKLDNAGGGTYNGVYSGVKYYKLTEEQCEEIIEGLAIKGQSDGLVTLFTAPWHLVDGHLTNINNQYQEVVEKTTAFKESWNSVAVVRDEIELIDENNYKPTNLNGYVPRNNKLFTHPYCYMLVTNNNGASAIYRYELFNFPNNPDLCDFFIYGTVTPGMSIRMSPRFYNFVEINSYEGINLGKFPICSWPNDIYTNWLTQNALNIGVGVGSGLAQAVLGGVTSGLTGGALADPSLVISGVSQVFGVMGEIYQHSFEPPQAEGNINSGDVSFSAGTLTFTVYQMTIKEEFARAIDGYFDMFGYKVNRVHKPLENHRENYWYTKTIDVNIDGNIPMEDMSKIKACYNNGITFWKNPANIGNYSVSNGITG